MPTVWNNVLIETSWNVKDKPRLLAVPAFRINRNIVECKDGMVDWFSGNRCRINRNIVECKDEYVEMANRGEMVLIETSWNVKKISECRKTGKDVLY